MASVSEAAWPRKHQMSASWTDPVESTDTSIGEWSMEKRTVDRSILVVLSVVVQCGYPRVAPTCQLGLPLWRRTNAEEEVDRRPVSTKAANAAAKSSM